MLACWRNLFMAEQGIEQPCVVFQLRRRVQEVQCRDRWTGDCLNKDCWAFQNIDGNHYCVKDGLP